MNATQTETAAPAVAGRVVENVGHGEALHRQARASDLGYLLADLVGDEAAHLPSADPPQVIALLRRLGGARTWPSGTSCAATCSACRRGRPWRGRCASGR